MVDHWVEGTKDFFAKSSVFKFLWNTGFFSCWKGKNKQRINMGFSRDNFCVKTVTKDEHWGPLWGFSPFKTLSLSCLFRHSGHVGLPICQRERGPVLLPDFQCQPHAVQEQICERALPTFIRKYCKFHYGKAFRIPTALCVYESVLCNHQIFISAKEQRTNYFFQLCFEPFVRQENERAAEKSTPLN